MAQPAEHLPGAVQPGRDRPQPELPQAGPEFNFSIESPQRSAVPRAVDEVHFKLSDIRITGAVTLSASQFRPFYENLIGHEVTLGDILDVADKIEAAYRKAGYILVRAYVPPQRVRDGVFTINIVEGYVSAITVQGGDAATQDQVRGYMAPVLRAHPLDLATMERALLITNDLPGVAATGVLRPSADTPGASELVVTIAQPKVTGGFSVDNRGSRFSGIWTLTGDMEINSPFGDGGALDGNVTIAPDRLESVAGQLRYRHAVGDDGLMGSLIGTITHGEPGSTLRAQDVFTNSYAIGPRLTYPILRSRAESLELDGGFTVQDARIDFEGLRISHDQWRVADIGIGYNRSGVFGGAFSGNIDLAQGLPILGATGDRSPMLSRTGGSTTFTKLTGLAQLAVPLPNAFSVALSAQGQYAFTPLILGEQTTFGGTQIGRGYDPGAITGDHGLGGSFELRYDHAFPDYHILDLQPYAFVDAARTWYIQSGAARNADLTDQSIASVGGGFRFWFPYNITADVELAHTLDAVAGSDDGKRTTKVLVDAAINF